MTASIKSLDVNADEINFDKRLIRINTINLDQPYFSIYELSRQKTPRNKSVIIEDEEIINDTNNLRWNPGKWDVSH